MVSDLSQINIEVNPTNAPTSPLQILSGATRLVDTSRMQPYEIVTRRITVCAGQLTKIPADPPRDLRTWMCHAFFVPGGKATGALLIAVSAGEITPQEAAELGKLIEGYVKALEASEFEERIARLEQRTTQ
jgi:hypothetical protein